MDIVTREMDMIAKIYVYDLDNDLMDVMVMMEIVMMEMEMMEIEMEIVTREMEIEIVIVTREIVMMEIVTREMEIVMREMEIEIVIVTREIVMMEIVTREMEMIVVIDDCNRMGNNVYELDNEDMMVEMTIEIVKKMEMGIVMFYIYASSL
jgi:hypothetical protein